jgi:hypothetical protein
MSSTSSASTSTGVRSAEAIRASASAMLSVASGVLT